MTGTAAQPHAAPPPREASFLGRFGWVMFDWANQPFFTIVTTFIFAPYFAAQMVGDPVRGQAIYGYTQSAAGLIIAILSPFLGAMADASGRRKGYILFFQVLTVIGCIGLWWAYPNRPDLVLPVAVALVIATIGAEFSIVFNNALLPSLVRPERIGRLSGAGWAMGYVGGIIALVAILIISRPELIGITPPEGQALFGLDRATAAAERLTGPASALWLVVFVVPMFLFTPDIVHSGLGRVAAAREGMRRLVDTVRQLRKYRNPTTFLAAYMIYNDGLAAVIALGGIYAAGTFGWGTTELGIFGILLTTVAAIAAFVGGTLDDRLGSKRTVQLAIVLVTIATIGIVSVTATSALFVLDLPAKVAGGALFGSIQEKIFFVFAVILGLGMGPMQAASRTMMGRLAPPGMAGEFYGLYALSGKATTFMAPFCIAVATQYFMSQRAAGVVVVIFLAVGFILLTRVREER